MKHHNSDFEYRQLNSENLTVDKSYQREINYDRVKKIVANYDSNLVNPLKVSHRDGKYYIFDGQHTLAAQKLKKGRDRLMVDCKVYEGLTAVDEAILFSQQNGISKPVETITKFRALYYAGDLEITDMVRLAEKAGLRIDFSKGKATYKIVAAAKLHKMYKALPANEFVDLLSIIRETWNGEPDSLCAEILGGMWVFCGLYKGAYDRKQLISKLSKVSPVKITREGKVFTESGDMRFAKQIALIYNKGRNSTRLLNRFS